MKSNKPLRIMMLTAVAAFVLSACGEQTAQQGPAPSAPMVDVAQVLHERVTEWDEFTGRLQAPESVTLIPRVSGYIDSVNFKEGALVKKGDVLFRIDPSVFEVEVARLKADLASALSAEQLATNDFERAHKLFDQKAVSAELLDTRESNKRQTAAAVASVKAALMRAELDLAYTQVQAPIDGRVSYANVTAGNYVTAGQSVLTSLVSTASMYAYFDVDEQTYLKYVKLTAEKKRNDPRAGDNPVYMALANERDYQHIGMVDFVDNAMDKQTGTIRVRASFDNEDNSLLPGLFARLRTAGSGAYEGILIDDKAVGTDLNNKFVLVVGADGLVEYRGVTLGEKVQGLRIVTQGLMAEDKIVVNGMQRVRPKMQIDPHMVEMVDSDKLEALRQAQLILDKNQDTLTAQAVETASRG
ncbi:efflux RND transporter periplasmic adaptor subunit [Shewanella baltica]|jgi:membrane fusion protein, multidrug efflux system|uniref:Efflux transporter, RND family, MFP subunit n=1 Tax=Shewanella baltica (strain OS155 / ATCC BAA-1091) TaxID=325240 RepID=A3D7F0_SHEB5|nr:MULTISPECIES: efflux RND transporter periplasmic adaptor subunit [Shewanella]ABN62663.1 efflux transporter, RND family, MFP subunit [Shewanella baltica OS155]AEH15001.1 efflux transporter, RND family, MFP subunit [Shewanella baltica OS117]KZK70692.1 efflux transporter periplasmic adaptor subunit [Shewanella baltica]MCS6133652.1 efflux RND transporter periplasmic adaptor subunit [Shewanella baltica]MCS6161168.1 efflux RND transporter periplasmic adaptor subunit [Shewanella baltica]